MIGIQSPRRRALTLSDQLGGYRVEANDEYN
jgi:hypothetical protein